MLGKIPDESKHIVDSFHGIKVNCGTTPCVFEIIAYRFVGEFREPKSLRRKQPTGKLLNAHVQLAC